MQKYLKIFLSILIAAIILTLLLPYAMGIATQIKFSRVLNEISAFSDLDIQVTSYHRHWFDSDATLTVDLNPQSTVPLEAAQLQKFLEKSQLQKVNLSAHILHGPVIFTNNKIKIAQAIIQASVLLNDEQNKLLQRALSAPPIITMNMNIKVNGRSAIDIDIPSFYYKNHDRNIKWQDMHLGLELSSSLHKISRVIDIPEMLLEAPNFNLYINSLHTSYKGKKETDNLWIGDNSFSLKSFKFSVASIISASMDNCETQSSFREQKGLISGDTTMSIDNFVINENKFTQSKLDWNINNFNMLILSKLKQEISNLDPAQIANQPIKQASHFLSLIQQLLSNNASIEVSKFEINTPWGEANAHGKITFPPILVKTESELDFVKNMEEELDLKLDKKLALNLVQNFLEYFSPARKKINYHDQAIVLLNNLKNAKTIIPDNNSYKLHLIYKDKKLMLNGIPFSLSSKT